MPTAPHNEHYTETHTTEPVVFLGFELSEKNWKLGFTTGYEQLLENLKYKDMEPWAIATTV